MSNRADRRAAERAAAKAARKAVNVQAARQSIPVASITADQPPAAARPATFPFPLDFTNEINQESITMPESNPEPESSEITGQESSAEKLARIRAGYAKLPSQAQIDANRQNAQKSTGAKTPEGKAAVSQNRRTHGFIGRFAMLATEDVAEYMMLRDDVIEEYKPQTPTEWRLAQSVMQHYWLVLRADRLQTEAINDPKKLALYMRYYSTHERSYYRAQKELQKLVKERAQEQIGFEQQTARQEAHEASVRLQHARAESIEIDSSCKKVMGAPIPGIENVSFKEVADACSLAITALVYGKASKKAAA